MNKIRRFGIVTFAMAALAGVFPQTALAGGSIRSINACDSEGNVITYSEPLQVTDVFYFRVRLLNYNWAGDPICGRTNFWDFVPVRANAEMFKPKLGILLGGRTNEATWVATKTHIDENPGFPFTDLIFSYEVKAGDLALPVELISEGGNRYRLVNFADSVGSSGSEVYWRLRDQTGVDCEFIFGSSDYPVNDFSDKTRWWSSTYGALPEDNNDYYLTQAGINVQTIDFDVQENESYTVRENGGSLTGSMSLVNPGGKSEGLEIYWWTEDSSIAKLVDDNFSDNRTLPTKWRKDGLGNPRIVHAYDQSHNAKDYLVYGVHLNDDGLTNILFKVQGIYGAKGLTTKVYFSTSPTFMFNGAGTLIKSFVERDVNVVEGLPVSLTWEGASDPAKPKAIDCNPAYDTAQATIRVQVQAYTNDLTLTLNPKLNGTALPAGIIGICREGEVVSSSTYLDTITIPASTQAEVDRGKLFVTNLLVYGLGFATNDVYRNPLTITFSPAITGDGGLFPVPRLSDLSVNEKSAVLEGAPTATVETTANDPNGYDLPPILIKDSYANLRDAAGYVIYWANVSPGQTPTAKSWKKLGSAKVAPTLNDNGDYKFDLNLTYTQSGSYDTYIKVLGPDGKWSSEDFFFSVEVASAMRAILATDHDSPGATDDWGIRQYNEGDAVKVSIKLEPDSFRNETGGYLYAFLVPQENTANYVSAAKFITTTPNARSNIRIANGDKVSSASDANRTFTIADGALDEGDLSFWVVLATDSNWSAVTNGYDNIDEAISVSNPKIEFIDKDNLIIEALNVAPKFRSVSMSGAQVGSEPMTADQGLAKTFTWSVNDVIADRSTLKTLWTVRDPGNSEKNYIVSGDPATTNFTYTFTQSGMYNITVKMLDKDMNGYDLEDFDGSDVSEFSFKVNVGGEPRTTFMFPDGSEGVEGEGVISYTFTEHSVMDHLNNQFTVGLSTPARDPVVIKVTASPYNGSDGTFKMAGADDTGAVYVTIPAGYTNGTFSLVRLVELDGTRKSGGQDSVDGGFVITATVTNTNVNADNIPYNEIYKQTKVTVQVANESPRLVLLSPYDPGSNGVHLAEGLAAGSMFSIEWMFRDVPADVATNFKVKFTGIYNLETNAANGSIEFSVGQSGGDLTLQVSDKDDLTAQVFRWKFKVVASKNLEISAIGPIASGQSKKSNEYLTAAGAGEGHVYVGDGTFSKILNFCHYHSFSPGVADAKVWACGYSVGDVDNGSLPDFDRAINSRGANVDGGNDFYKYTDGTYDSFFYAWIVNQADDQNSWVGTAYPSPQIGTNNFVSKTFAFSNETEGDDEEDPVYPSLILEAAFSREWRPADNLGDINQDGIPDVFAAAKAYDGGILYEVVGGGGGEGGGAEGDLKNIRGFNDDEDYLPATTSSGNSLIPNVVANWATTGVKFDAYYEVRGFGPGLNYRKSGNKLNYNVRGAWVSNVDFTPAETNAYLRYCATIVSSNDAAVVALAEAACVAAGGDPTDPEALAPYLEAAYGQYVFSAEFLETVDWSPENRTDPTMEDTDSDGLPDGYEYFFWYRALVGDKDGNQMVGSKFNPNNIAQGIEIKPEEIIAAFNPTVGSNTDVLERDTDADGLTDLEELAIGTNPVNWDTDGDGVSDLYEVMWALDPLKDFDMAPGDKNPDGDYMASWTSGKTWAVVTVKGKGIYAVDESVAVLDGYVEGSKKDEGTIDASAEDVTINNAIPVFWYGADGTTPVPKSREGCLTNFVSVVVTSNDTATVLRGKALRLIHDQVYDAFDFDPRTGWYSNNKGAVGDRWVAVSGDGDVFVDGTAGRATNTVAFTTLDEYLLCKYRKETGLAGGDKLRDDLAASYTGTRKTVATLLWKGCTAPNMPKSGVTYGDLADTFGFDNIYGADTDGDGVPDGWELYVGANPNYAQDGSSNMNKSEGNVHDSLTLVEEYAGTDSCNAYSNTPSIFANHPGEKSGWYNKFFPTNPKNPDTDGDGLSDSEEGKSWRGSFYAGRKGGDTETMSTAFTFIYGPRTADGVDHGMPESDDGSRCIRGGGLNPCTVDTDLDLLPDGWERQFAGVVFNAEGQPEGNTLPADVVKLFRFSDGLDDAVGNVLATPTGYYISGGMDGTYGPKGNNQPGDAFTAFNDKVGAKDPRTGTRRDCDWDHDGLENFQEYLVQTLRHLRYDDCETPLMGYQLEFGMSGLIGRRPFKRCIPFQAFDGTAYYEECRKAGFRATSSWKFRELGYFARPPHEWDRVALNTTGNDNCKNYEDYEGVGYRILLPPKGLSYEATSKNEKRLEATGYVSTDPRRWDTDDDGLDDYWEIFHGLNPLLGSSGFGMNDVIAEKYNFLPNSWQNAWTGWPLLFPPQPAFDAFKYPWMIGTPECDADGDGIRNAEEGLFVNITTPSPKHTDPTPLWMTDKTSPNNTSFTSQYYRMDPYMDTGDFGTADLMYYPWGWQSRGGAGTSDGQVMNYMFSFEENEGYDTDSDRRSDSNEGVKMVENASDPLVFADPDRRQALYLPGLHEVSEGGAVVTNGSAVVSRGGSDTMQKPISTSYDLLRQFTVEAWVKPEKLSDDTEQVILERVANYSPSTLSNNTPVIRANFRLGITTDNRYFAEFEGNTEDSGVQRLVGTEVDTNEWTHLAFTFDGSTFAMYVNDEEAPVAKAENISLIPANGIVIIKQEAGSSTPVQNRGYTAAPCAFLIGARAVTGDAIALSKDTTWDAFGDYYTGWIDEVRVWDGARTGAEIAADCQKRYSFADVKSRRQAVYQSWVSGATRNNVAGKVLPTELVQHYNFSTLAGAVDSGSVMQEPLQFTENVLDNVRIGDESVDDVLGEESGGLRVGWWWEIPVHSSVYTNYHLVPWVQNTCAHLPFMDGSTPDSMYWCENFGGLTPASTAYSFPNTANPYPFYNYLADRAAHAVRLERFAEGENSPYAAFEKLYEFQMRSGFVGTSDLVPLGGAFAKRSSEMWDGAVADAWTQTGTDSDSDGLPDWWEAFVAAGGSDDIKYLGDDGNPLAAEDITWSAMVWRNGVKMTLAQAYLRDLAEGMVYNSESGDVVVESAYAASADENGNGLPDWWEKLYAIYGEDTAADHDNDQLSNYAEYLIGECFTKVNGINRKGGYDAVNDVFKTLSPLDMFTYREEGQRVPDYFRRVGSLYLGEMFTDHDFMEDWWERYINNPDYTSRYSYDPLKDTDGDGWNNFAECRYSLWKALTTSDLVDRWLDNNLAHVACRPEPAIGLKVSYYGNKDVSGSQLVVRSSPNNVKVRDAMFVIPSAVSGTQEATSYIGPYRKNAVIHGHLNPGNLGPGSGRFYRVALASDKKYQWSYEEGRRWWFGDTSDVSAENGSFHIEAVHSYGGAGPWHGIGTFEEYLSEYAKYPWIVLEDVSLKWTQFASTKPKGTDGIYGQIIYSSASTTNGTTTATSGEIGTINYRTGEFEIDMAKLAVAEGSTAELEASVFKVDYSYRIGVEWPQTVYLSQPDSGYIHEGANVVSAFFDLDGNGTWTAGEPFGVAPAVNVGWWKSTTEIELTDTSSSMARFDLSTLLGSSSSSGGSSSSGNSTASYTDRDVNGSLYGNVTVSNSVLPSSTSANSIRLRVVRDAFNGVSYLNSEATFREVVLDRTFSAELRPMFSEADLVAEGLFDLDWATVFPAFSASQVGSNSKADLKSVTYRVFVGNDDIIAPDEDTSVLPIKFVNAFEESEYQSPTTLLTPAGTIDSARPTFTWRHDNTINKDYPAFRLRVYKANGSTLVYDSGVRKAPPRNGQGVYSWTAPLYANMVTAQGQIFATTNNYKWSVSMLDAKFPSSGPNEARKEFRLETSGASGSISDYGTIEAQVKYFGPGTMSTAATTSREKLIRVQAFDTPDFTGDPAGEAYVTDVSDIASISNFTVNARIIGLKSGTYYVRAFIDTNGDGVRQDWESWGYANYVGTEQDAVYNPKGLSIDGDNVNVPVATVYIEDADTDDDGFPDVYEWDQKKNLTAIGPATGDTFFTEVNPDLLATMQAYSKLGVSVRSAAAQAPIFRLMSAGTSSASGLNAFNDLLSGSGSVENETDIAVVIDSFSLEDGMTISIDPAVYVGNSGILSVSTTPVSFNLELKHKASLAEDGWETVASVPIALTANEPVTLTGDDLAVMRAKIAEIQTAGQAGFFKVVLTK